MAYVNPRLARQIQERVYAGFYSDKAVLIRKVATGAYDEYNHPVTTTTETVMKCSVTDQPSQEDWRDFADIGNVYAEIRIVGIAPTKSDLIKITHRFGEPIAEQTCEIAGIRNRGILGYVCALKLVTL